LASLLPTCLKTTRQEEAILPGEPLVRCFDGYGRPEALKELC
jgi:hypothetical protein